MTRTDRGQTGTAHTIVLLFITFTVIIIVTDGAVDGGAFEPAVYRLAAGVVGCVVTVIGGVTGDVAAEALMERFDLGAP